jgi:PAS domain S-box-containing protein
VEHDFPRVGRRVIRLNARRIEGSADDLSLILLALEDVTERAQRERQDVIDMPGHQIDIDSLPLVAVEWDPEGKVRRWSRQGEEKFGWKAAEVVGRSAAEVPFVAPEDAARLQGAFRALASDKKAKILFQCGALCRDGQTIDCEWFASLFRDRDGKPSSFLTMLRDLEETERIGAAGEGDPRTDRP